MKVRGFWFASLLLLPAVFAGDKPAPKKSADKGSDFVFSLLPKAFSKDPFVNMTVFTEMTEAGKKITPPTPDNPAYYFAESGGFHVFGPSYGNLTPPSQELIEGILRKTLADEGYRPEAPPEHAATLAVIYSWGMHNKMRGRDDGENDDGPPDPYAGIKNLYDRAALIGGESYAKKLVEANIAATNQAADLDSSGAAGSRIGSPVLTSGAAAFLKKMNPVQRMYNSSSNMANLMEQTNDDVYFVVASAYDYQALATGRRKLLWRTKMTVDTKGVSMADTMPAVIVAAAPYFGHETDEAVALTKRVVRQGKVEVGTPTVVEPVKEPAKK